MRFVAWAVLASLALTACGPFGPVPGGRVHGELVMERIQDFGFTDEHRIAVVETRPRYPHSVTTIFFVYEGTLYVPSREPRGKRWPRFVLEDPSVRIQIDGKVYAGRLVRDSDPTRVESFVGALRAKYQRPAPAAEPEPRPEVWFFRFEQS
jgi:hypothetical protein